MFVLHTQRIRSFERGLHFKDGEFQGLLGPGRHWLFDPLCRDRVDVVSLRDPWLWHRALDMIVRSGALGDQAQVLDLKDNERALVWIDGRFDRVLMPGLYAIWTGYRQVEVELVDAREARFTHRDLKTILKWPEARTVFDIHVVEDSCVGVLYKDGNYVDTVGPGEYVFWKSSARVKMYPVGVRETVLDVMGQDIMTADKVTLRMNAVVTYRVTDARTAVSAVADVTQALYREAQLALRAVIGTRELDALLTDKDTVAEELEATVRKRATTFGLEVVNLGIRDVILPGEMKNLLNRVTEAKKAAEANLIARREETAAMRSQANTARLLESNPTLMRLRELEVLENIAKTTNLNVLMGEQGLTDRVVKIL